jgi:hypothetical protein
LEPGGRPYLYASGKWGGDILQASQRMFRLRQARNPPEQLQ